jgi:hypothetical protein
LAPPKTGAATTLPPSGLVKAVSDDTFGSGLSRPRALLVCTAETLHGVELIDGRTDGSELSLKLYHESELQVGYQHSMAGAPIYRFEKVEAWAQTGWSFGRRPRFFQALLSDVLPLGSLHPERHERSCILDLLPDSRIRSATAKTVQKKTIWGSALLRVGNSYCHPVVTFPAVISLDTILSLCGRGRLPLHVRGAVSSAPLKRLNMIDHITLTRTRSLTGGWARVGLHEIMLLRPRLILWFVLPLPMSWDF